MEPSRFSGIISRHFDREMVRLSPVGGGSICSGWQIVLEGGTCLFLKTLPADQWLILESESAGLKLLKSENGPLIGEVVYSFQSDDGCGLVLDWIEQGQPANSFRLGEQLAAMHRERRSEFCGLDQDNYIGLTPQSNRPCRSWFDFFADCRLLPQIRMAVDSGAADFNLANAVDRICHRLPQLLIEPDDQTPSLLHGDLWSGNLLYDREGNPVLIDPAVYFGHREADLAMMQLFGDPGDSFRAGYGSRFPLEPGYGERRDLYNLYHLLNHLNLFGVSYQSACRAVIRKYS